MATLTKNTKTTKKTTTKKSSGYVTVRTNIQQIPSGKYRVKLTRNGKTINSPSFDTIRKAVMWMNNYNKNN
jgi:hypothetical protein